jgi:hypothetical protein
MARSRQTETRRPHEADETDDERDAYEDEADAPYEDEEPDSQYEDEYEDDDHEGDETDDDGSSPDTDRSRRPSKRRMSAASAAQAALRNLAELTTKEPTGITSLESSDDGWVVGVEVVEDKRVPSSADILAVYEAEIDGEDGSLVSYRRERRYSRGQGDR